VSIYCKQTAITRARLNIVSTKGIGISIKTYLTTFLILLACAETFSGIRFSIIYELDIPPFCGHDPIPVLEKVFGDKLLDIILGTCCEVPSYDHQENPFSHECHPGITQFCRVRI
jgi:hypothetical protein